MRPRRWQLPVASCYRSFVRCRSLLAAAAAQTRFPCLRSHSLAHGQLQLAAIGTEKNFGGSTPQAVASPINRTYYINVCTLPPGYSRDKRVAGRRKMEEAGPSVSLAMHAKNSIDNALSHRVLVVARRTCVTARDTSSRII